MKEIIKRVKLYVRQPWRLAVPLKRLAVFATVFGLVVFTAYNAVESIGEGRRRILSLIVLWGLLAYYVLPKVHRVLSQIYVPNYFIGRARTADGLLADPVNFAVRGDRAMLLQSMQKAGWTLADPLSFKSGLGIAAAIFRKKSYPNAPVSDLFVFGKRQAFAFQKEVDGDPKKRHHVRFWRVPSDMFLPGGYKVDWVAAATYDDAVGFSLFTLQLTHSIDGDVDQERDFVVSTLKQARRAKNVHEIEGFFPSYKHRNGGGHKFFTDGSMVIVDLKKKSII